MSKYYDHDLARWEGEGGGVGPVHHGAATQDSSPTPDRATGLARALTPGKIGLPRAFLLILLCVFASAIAAAQDRALSGVVTDRNGQFIKGAAVKLTNTLTLQVWSYITQENGEYRFHGLHPDVDYTVRARFRDHVSKTRTLTRFNEREIARIDLRIDGVETEADQ